MLAKSWLSALIGAAVLTAGTAWATIGPDSLWQNVVVDPARAKKVTDCHLAYWNGQPSNNDRTVVVCIHGWYKDGEPSMEEARKVFLPAVINFASCAGGAEKERFEYCLFTYNPDLDPREVASRLRDLLEGDSRLTKASTRFILLNHSFAGWVSQSYIAEFGRRKVLGRLSAGTPWRGDVFADKKTLTDAMTSIYPHIGGYMFRKLTKGVDFDTGSLKWMSPGDPERQKMLASCPPDETCFLYVGETWAMPPTSLARYTTPLMVYDAWGWGIDSISSNLAYHFGAAVIQASGDSSGSDGVVSVASASAEGFNRLATVRRMGQYNHSQIIQGNQGDFALHQQMYQDMVTLLPAEEAEEEINDFLDPAVAETPDLSGLEGFAEQEKGQPGNWQPSPEVWESWANDTQRKWAMFPPLEDHDGDGIVNGAERGWIPFPPPMEINWSERGWIVPPSLGTMDVDWSRCPRRGAEDSDKDGLPNYFEVMLGTDPYNIAGYPVICTEIDNPDTDGDGMSDGAELCRGTNPCDHEVGGVTSPNHPGWTP